MPNHIDQDYQVKGQSGQTYTARVVITQDAWNKADQDVQNQTNQILAVQPIPLLPINGTGKGFKRESNGWTIHTQTNKRLYATNDLGPAPRRFEFDSYKKSPHDLAVDGQSDDEHDAQPEHTTMPSTSATAERDSTPILTEGGDTSAQAPITPAATTPHCTA
jgi:hypothetical protein